MRSNPFDFEAAAGWQYLRYGLLALAMAVVSLAQLRGISAGLVLLFGLPIVFAALHTNASCSAATRRVAWAFLAAVAFGAIVAHEQRLFPALGGVDRRLGIVQDRVLTWYVGVYAFWACVVLPSHLFMGSLRNHRRGTPAAFSRFTFYLGLGAVILMCIGLPSVLGLLGFWPAL
jgi:hypothetical protein